MSIQCGIYDHFLGNYAVMLFDSGNWLFRGHIERFILNSGAGTN